MNQNTPQAKIRERLLSPLEFANDVRIVAAWDVVRQARRPFFFFSRMMLAGLVSFQVLWMWSTMFRWRDEAVREGASELTPAAIAIMIQSIFQTSNFIVAVSLILLCPVLTAGCVAGDRERKIWHDLANSPLSGWSIVMGKMVARLATIVAWILVVLPIWAILGLLGGLDPRQVVVGFIAFFFYGWFYAAIGLLASVLTARTRDALGLATSMVVFLLILPMLDDQVRLMFFNGRMNGFFEDFCNATAIFNPVVTLFYELSNWRNSTQIAGWLTSLMAIQAIILSGPIVTLIAGLLLRPMSRRLESKAARSDSRKQNQSRQADRQDAFARSDGDSLLALTWFSPLAIKERKIRSGSRLGRAVKNILLMIGLLIGGYYLVVTAAEALAELSTQGWGATARYKRSQLMAMIMGISSVLHPMLIYSLMLDAAGRILAEKESDTWLTLLSTPVAADEILQSKAFGTLWGWRVPLGFLAVSCLIGFISGAIGPLGLLLGLIVWGVHAGFCLALGLRFGLTCKSYQAAALKCVGVWLLLEFFIPFFSSYILRSVALGVHPTIIAAAVLAIEQFSLIDMEGWSAIMIGAITTLIWFLLSVSIFRSTVTEFDRLNNRTLKGPGEFEKDL